MLDDLERAKQQYKANIIQDFHDQAASQGMYGPTAMRTSAYKRPGLAGAGMGVPGEPMYGGTKSMYNQQQQQQGPGGMYDSKSMYGGDTKSMYSG